MDITILTEIKSLKGFLSISDLLPKDWTRNGAQVTLALDRPVAWNKGQGVRLEYFSAAWDIGAHEHR